MRSKLFASCLISLVGCNSVPNQLSSEIKPAVLPTTKEARVSAPVVALASAPASLASALVEPSTEPKQKPLPLYDPRPGIPLTKISAADKKVLGLVFSKYKKSPKQCSKLPDDETRDPEDDLDDGQIVPVIMAVAQGSFTKPKAKQSVYVIDVGECHAEVLRDSPQTTPMVVVIEGKTIIHRGNISFRDYLFALDLDQDGIDELLALQERQIGFIMQQSLSLFHFDGEEFSELESHDVLVDSCDALRKAREAIDPDIEGEEGNIEATVLGYLPLDKGELPAIHKESFVASCEKGSPYLPSKK